MRQLSWAAVAAALFMIIALCVAGFAQWDRWAVFAVVAAMCSITCGLLALRDR
jgi:uncharacterized membrane protein